MKTNHRLYLQNARDMSAVPDRSVDFVITSPPYPMIEMWDGSFSSQSKAVEKALSVRDGCRAFELMHQLLDPVWLEIRRVLKPGGLACINIGDATRTINDRFQLFNNHSRIASAMSALGLCQLPGIIWRKQTNAPNKFMGSGMLPAGAYMTLEHEHILIFRNGGKRLFSSEPDKQGRCRSAYFWEERNAWFSDVWLDLKGVRQNLENGAVRKRSASFPFELPYRLVNMFSTQGDLVLDPFLGAGTTMAAAMCAGRHCIGFESDGSMKSAILQSITKIDEISKQIADQRLKAHAAFVRERMQTKRDLKHVNGHYGFAVMTRQEKELRLTCIRDIVYLRDDEFEVDIAWYEPETDAGASPVAPDEDRAGTGLANGGRRYGRQLTLF